MVCRTPSQFYSLEDIHAKAVQFSAFSKGNCTPTSTMQKHLRSTLKTSTAACVCTQFVNAAYPQWEDNVLNQFGTWYQFHQIGSLPVYIKFNSNQAVFPHDKWGNYRIQTYSQYQFFHIRLHNTEIWPSVLTQPMIAIETFGVIFYKEFAASNTQHVLQQANIMSKTEMFYVYSRFYNHQVWYAYL